MVDLNKYVADILKQIAPVELANSEENEKIPCITIDQYGNSTDAVINGKEYLSDVFIQVDVYGCTPKETNEMAVKASGELTRNGFQRTAGRSMGTTRYMMTFCVKVDEISKHFYQ
ncbi:MAG: hypothetical protein MJ095_02215 [Oscillospiraceae bacterium]|nr:hypothetical protein [Oscillospiraceae bacterium]